MYNNYCEIDSVSLIDCWNDAAGGFSGGRENKYGAIWENF
jgi:hypothetical protein